MTADADLQSMLQRYQDPMTEMWRLCPRCSGVAGCQPDPTSKRELKEKERLYTQDAARRSVLGFYARHGAKDIKTEIQAPDWPRVEILVLFA